MTIVNTDTTFYNREFKSETGYRNPFISVFNKLSSIIKFKDFLREPKQDNINM